MGLPFPRHLSAVTASSRPTENLPQRRFEPAFSPCEPAPLESDFPAGQSPQPPQPPGRPENTQARRAEWATYAALLAAILLVFCQTFRHDFVSYDDDIYVYANSKVTQGLTFEGIAWAFTENYADNWHPLTWLSHMLDWQVYEGRAGGHHLTSILLHAATAMLLLVVLRQMTGRLWPSAFVAAVFAIHPLRVESVAWVAERKDVLSGLCFVLTLGLYVEYVRRPFSLARYLPVVLLFAVGLLAKPMLVTLPLVLLLLDYWPLGRFPAGNLADDDLAGSQARRRLLLLIAEKIPLLALSAVSCLLTLCAQQAAMERRLHLGMRIANALLSYVTYLGQLFWPSGLVVFHPHRGEDLPRWEVFAAFCLLLAISAIAVFLWRRCPYLLVGWFWFLGMLVPVIGLVQVGGQAMADRYTYLPQIGLVIALCWGAVHLLHAWPHRRWALGAGSAVALACLMGAAWQQTTHWRNSETLWTYTLTVCPTNVAAHNSLGCLLSEQGKMDEAIVHFREALKVSPGYAKAHMNLGMALQAEGKMAEALVSFERAVQLSPQYTKARLNLAMALERQGRTADAAACFHQAMQYDPRNPMIYFTFGTVLAQHGQMKEAVEQWLAGLQLEPRDVFHLVLAARVLASDPDASARNGSEAIELAQRAAMLTGGQDPGVLDILAAACAETGHFPEAVAIARQGATIATAAGDTAMADTLRERIKLYERNSPFRYQR